MLINDLIHKTEWKAVQKSLELYYGGEKTEQISELYHLLCQLSPRKNSRGMTLYIWVFETINTNCKLIQDYIEVEHNHTGKTFHFDVCGLEDSFDDDIVYSIERCNYRNFLGYYVSDYVWKCFTYETAVAHFLWEIYSDTADESRAL